MKLLRTESNGMARTSFPSHALTIGESNPKADAPLATDQPHSVDFLP
jgi:hypothetical protein